MVSANNCKGENVSREYVILGTIKGNATFGDRRRCEEFSDAFKFEVLDREDWAWYVDYWSEDVERYNVRYFSKIPLIHWTNENLEQRDPKDPESRWGNEDVERWFTSNGHVRPTGTYAHTFEFVAGHRDWLGRCAEDSTHRVRIEAGGVAVDGKRDKRAWDRYLEHGIRGALAGFRIKRLVSLTIEQV